MSRIKAAPVSGGRAENGNVLPFWPRWDGPEMTTITVAAVSGGRAENGSALPFWPGRGGPEMSRITAAAVSGSRAESRYNRLSAKKDKHPSIQPILQPPASAVGREGGCSGQGRRLKPSASLKWRHRRASRRYRIEQTTGYRSREAHHKQPSIGQRGSCRGKYNRYHLFSPELCPAQ
jgi:hypothetical protein